MDFTDDMIRDVLFALKYPDLRAQHTEDGHFELAEQEVVEPVLEKQPPRPSGRHFRDDSMPAKGAFSTSSTIQPFRESSAKHRQVMSDDKLYTPARDYIVTVINRIIRRLERAG